MNKEKSKKLLKKQMTKKDLSVLEKTRRVYFERPLGTISIDTKRNYNRKNKSSQKERNNLKLLY